MEFFKEGGPAIEREVDLQADVPAFAGEAYLG
jgi:hypothetical protein